MHLPSLLAPASIGIANSSTGCGPDIPSKFPRPGSNKTLHLPGTGREYQLFIPATYDKNEPAPLYFSFHGASKDMLEQEELPQFSNPEFNKDGITVYPNSKNGYWLSNPKADTSRPNDLDFTNDLLTHLEEKFCIDRSRIYPAGKSNGGGLTGVIACNVTVGSRFAALAAVSGAWYNTVTSLAWDHTTAPIDGNTEDPPKLPVTDILEGWAERSGCPGRTKWARNETVFEHPLVKHVSWDCAGKEGIVQHYREGENGHCWPSTVTNDDYESHPEQCPLGKYIFNATEYILDFFAGYRLDL